MPATRFVSVTRTGNECDIIEPFVRHHAVLFDAMLIIDDDSSDGTWTILEHLRDEGLPLVLYRAADVDWPVLDYTTRLMHIAFADHGADWVAPLDTDEFVEPPTGAGLGDVLPRTRDVPGLLRWNNFAWHRSIDEKTEINPVVRMKMRMPPRTDSFKLIIPRDALGGDRDARLLNGNHGLRRAGSIAPLLLCPQMALCHYPIRSVQQYISKSVINHLRYAALARNGRTDGFQYDAPFELAKGPFSRLLAEIADQMERTSPVYAMQKGGEMLGQPGERPLDYRGGALRHTIAPSAFTNLVNLAERLARRVSELESRQA